MGLIELIGALIVALCGAFFYGSRKGKQREQNKSDEKYIESSKRINGVSVDTDPGVLRDWLHERGK